MPKACSKSHSILHNQLRQHESNVESTVGHVGSHLLELEFLRELLIELLQLSDEFTAGFDDSSFGCDFAVGVDAELESREERVRDLVGGEGDVLHAVELVAEHVGEGVVFLVESEESGVCDLCICVLESLVLDCDPNTVSTYGSPSPSQPCARHLRGGTARACQARQSLALRLSMCSR